MRKNKLTLVAFVLSGSILLSSCVGSFGLFNRLSSWNRTLGNKFVNELVFLAFNIVPYMVLQLWQICWLSTQSSSGQVPTPWRA